MMKTSPIVMLFFAFAATSLAAYLGIAIYTYASNNNIDDKFNALVKNEVSNCECHHRRCLCSDGLRVLTANDRANTYSSGFSNGVIRLNNVKEYEFHIFSPSRLVKEYGNVELNVGDEIVVNKNNFITFIFAGDSYRFNYICNSTQPGTKNETYFDGALTDELYVTVDCNNPYCTRRDKDFCHIKFNISHKK